MSKYSVRSQIYGALHNHIHHTGIYILYIVYEYVKTKVLQDNLRNRWVEVLRPVPS